MELNNASTKNTKEKASPKTLKERLKERVREVEQNYRQYDPITPMNVSYQKMGEEIEEIIDEEFEGLVAELHKLRDISEISVFHSGEIHAYERFWCCWAQRSH